MSEKVSVFTIGIAGGTGSGKTTLATAIMEEFSPQQISYMPHDNYYRDQSHLPVEERNEVNYDHPDTLESSLLASHLSVLKAGEPVRMPIYDFKTHTRLPETQNIEPNPVIIVEGILVLSAIELLDLLDMKLFVDTDVDTRLIRRTKRDIAERGRTMESVFQQWEKTVQPMHLKFVEPSKRNADLHVPRGHNDMALKTILAQVTKQINSQE